MAQKKEINAFNDPGESIIFQVTGAPETYRHRGYFYVNRRASENTRAPGRSRDRYVHPRTIIEGQWITREKTVGNAGVTTFRTAAAHTPVYADLFYQTLCCWHAPMVRWAVGSDVALSGPQLSIMNLDMELDADHAYNPANADIQAYSSAFQVVRNVVHPLLKFKKATITEGAEFEESLQMIAASRTHYTQFADGTLHDEDDKANEHWAEAFPVPFRAGMYPFPADHRFPHQAAQQIASIGLDAELGADEYDLHVPDGIFLCLKIALLLV